MIRGQNDSVKRTRIVQDLWSDWVKIRTLEQTKGSKLSELLEHYNDIFQHNVGRIPDFQGKLCLKEGTDPTYIITKIENSEWETPVVKPNGNIRFCADHKVTFNKVVQDINDPTRV